MSSLGKLKRSLYLYLSAYFRFWADISLKRWNPRVIAVTGSVGKTTMLHLLELQLGELAHYSHNANSSFGVAFDIVGLRGITNTKWRWLYLAVAVPIRALWFKHDQEFYVVEIDGERPKEAEFLAKWLKPEVTLWVSLGRSHAAHFDGQVKKGLFTTVEEAIANEFASLVRASQKLVIIDSASSLMRRFSSDIQAERRQVSSKDLKNYSVWPDKTEFKMVTGTFSFAYPMPRETYVQLAMIEVAMAYLKLPVRYNMGDFTMPPGRSSYLRGKNGLKIIDSSYNAHLISMTSILQMMQDMQTDHKWLVIGDMIEQGAGEAEEHVKLGKILSKVDAEKYVLVGRRVSQHTSSVLEKSGLGDKTVSFTKTSDALEYLNKELTGKETVLLKGSQYLEWIAEKLLDDPSDIVKLARQELAAKKRRAKWGLN